MIVAACDAKAARAACARWHYSRSLPAGKLVKYGVWDDEVFQGVILFGRGATPHLGAKYDLRIYEICELVRIALRREHAFPVTQAVAVTLRMLRRDNPGLRLVVSFADPTQGHHGGIYQAGNWIYAGPATTANSTGLHVYRVNGVDWHPKTLHSRYGKGGQSIPWLREHVDPAAERVWTPAKHRYLYPLDAEMRRQIEPLRSAPPAPVV